VTAELVNWSKIRWALNFSQPTSDSDWHRELAHITLHCRSLWKLYRPDHVWTVYCKLF